MRTAGDGWIDRRNGHSMLGVSVGLKAPPHPLRTPLAGVSATTQSRIILFRQSWAV